MNDSKDPGREKSDDIDLGMLLSEKERLESLIKRKFTKTITVMFTDLSGSTKLSEQIGDLQMRGLIKRHYDIITPAIKDNNGVLVKTMGDGTLSYFAEPDNAIVAAMEIERRMTEFNEDSRHPELLVRCGLNTGLGIVEKDDIYGDVVNFAQRLEALAKPLEILISEETFGKIKNPDQFRAEFITKTKIKGKAKTQAVYKIYWQNEGTMTIEAEKAEYALNNGSPSTQSLKTTNGPDFASALHGVSCKLIVKKEKGEPRSYLLGQTEQIIGRSTKADIKIAELYISRKHAKIFFNGNNHIIEDLKSHIGTSHNGVRFDRHVLEDGDLITIGGVELIYSRVVTSTKNDAQYDEEDGQATMSLGHIPSLSLLLLEQGQISTSFDIGREPLMIGRLDSCDIHLQSPMISRNHARIWMEGDKAMIEDLGSNNGTYVGKAKVKKGEVTLGEDIKIGPFKLKLVNPNTFEGADSKAGENPKLVQRMISFLKKKNR